MREVVSNFTTYEISQKKKFNLLGSKASGKEMLNGLIYQNCGDSIFSFAWACLHRHNVC